MSGEVEDVVSGRCKHCGHKLMTWTAPSILAAIRGWASAHGRSPGFNDWANGTPEHPATATVAEMFGTWNQAITAAGLEPQPRGGGAIFWTADRIVEAMLDWLARTGEWPSTIDWLRASPTHPCTRTVYQTFGSWRSAQLQAGWHRDCAVCGSVIAFGRAGKKYCSTNCRKRASSRKRSGLPVRDQPAISEPRCVGCGGEYDTITRGCRPCQNRARKRRKFAAVSAPVETHSLASPGPYGETAAEPTTARLAA